MKHILEYLIEAQKVPTVRKAIKFIVWKDHDNRGTWVDVDNEFYKIEYQYHHDNPKFDIEFLMGMKDGEWALWKGAVGKCSYDQPEWKILGSSDFKTAMISAVDEVESFIKEVADNPIDWKIFYDFDRI